MIKIGILALQGDFEKHRQMMEVLGYASLLVRTRDQLASCAGLIIPGGESTTLAKMMKKHDMWEGIREFSRRYPIFGTCAGLIVLAKKAVTNNVETLGLIDIRVVRNAYGRQVDSFIDDVTLHLDEKKSTFEGVFIRAPKIDSIGRGVKPLAWHGDEIVMVEEGNVLVTAFHPELTDDTRVHEYWVKKINVNNRIGSG